MAMDIYSRVAELVVNKKNKVTDEQIFTSQEYLSFLKRKAANIITGSFYNLRNIGFVVSQQEESRILRNLDITLSHDSKNEELAFAASSNDGRRFTVWINTGNNLVMMQESREEKHFAILGALYHEVGHLLFSDYPTLRAWSNQLLRGKWFPKAPDSLNTVNGVNLSTRMDDPVFCDILTSCANHLANSIEDGYIEREIKLMCPGKGAGCLNVLNDSLLTNSKSLLIDANDEKCSPFNAILNQILLYSKFEEMSLENYTGDLLDPIYESIEILDQVKFERDSRLRFSATNELLCILFPYLEKEVEEEQKRQEEQANQSQGQQGQGQQGQGQQGQGQGQQGQSQQGQGGGGNSPKTPIPQSVADAIKKAMDKTAQNAGATNQNDDCTSKALNNPSAPKNANSQPQQPTGDASSSTGGAGSDSGDAPLDAAERELKSLVDDIAKNEANQQAETERTKEMNKDAKNMDCSDIGLPSPISVTVTRASSVSDANRKSYDEEMEAFASISRDLQRSIKRILKDRREGGKRKNLPFGRKLEISSIVHDDGKYFSRNKLPTESPRLGVGLLVDESGSTSGQLIAAATCASLVVEDFCRELQIPHIINGYTSGYGKSATILSYAEPNEIDDGNRYRVTGMSARGGTPTKTALAYMIKRMNTLSVDVKLLIIISDGQSGDNGFVDGEFEITRIIREAKRHGVIVVAAGIGENRRDVEKEFGDNFLDISNLQDMPEQLTELIKDNLWV